jgi:hypothetical protein
MSQRVLALPAPGNQTQTETVNKNTKLATRAKNKKLTGSASFSGSRSRLGVGNESTYQTQSVGHRRIDQVLRDHNTEMRKYQGDPTRLWMTTVQLHQNLEDMEQESSNVLNKARSASKKAKSNPNSPKNEQKRLDEKVKEAKTKHLKMVSAVEKAESLVGKRGRDSPSGKTTGAISIKRTKSTEKPLAMKTELDYLKEKAELEKKLSLWEKDSRDKRN